MADIPKVRRNIARMIEQGAPEADIDAYIAGEGVTLDAVKAGVQTDQSAGGYVTNVARNVAKGATFNLADEIAAVGDAALGTVLRTTDLPEWARPGKGSYSDAPTFGQRYDENLKYHRDRDKAFERSNPVSAIGAQIAGGAAATVPAFVAAAPATLGKAMMQGARVGAVAGGVGGFGEGEGGFGNRAENAVVGAGLGAGLGAVIPAGIQGASSAVRGVRRAFDAGQADDVARSALVRALQRDGMTPEQLGTRMGEFQQTGRPVMPIDAGGENLRWLARAATAQPGPARNQAATALADRQAGQPGRVVAALDDSLQARGGGYYDNIDDMMRQRSTEAAPLYQQAHAYNGGLVSSPVLDRTLKAPSVKDAMGRAIRLAGDEGVPATELRLSLGKDGEIIVDRVPSMIGWDYIKRGLDDVVEANKDGFGKLSQQGRAADNLRKTILSELDAANPYYAAARSAWAGPTRAIEVQALGRKAITEDAEVTAAAVRRMSPSEQEFFRDGVRRALVDTAKRTQDGADVVKRIFGNPLIRERIAAAFPDDASFRKFATTMGQEGQMYAAAQASNANKGAQTTPLAEAIGDFRGGDVMEPARVALSGQPVRGVLAMAMQGAKKRMEGVTDRTSGALARDLYSSDPGANAKLIKALIAARQRQQLTDAGRRYRGVALVPGVMAGVE